MGAPARHSARRAGLILIPLFVLLAAGITTGGYFSYRNYERHFRVEVGHQLAAVAELKVNELAQWRRERLADGSLFLGNAVFSGLVRRWFETQEDSGARAQITAWLGRMQAADQYDRVVLLDARGVPRLSVPETSEPKAAHLSRDALEVLRSGRVGFLDLHRDAPGEPAQMAVVVPILEGAERPGPLGVLVLRIDPERYLYPFVQRWPIASRTAETLLVRPDGSDVLFLNELRFQKHTALTLRQPLTRANLPAAKAALGQEGVEAGVDYRGIPVLAAVRVVPDSPWSLVARMDTAEVYGPLRERRWMLVAFVGVTLLAAGAGVGFVWRQLRSARERTAAAEEAAEHHALLQGIIESTAAPIFSVDADYRYTTFNAGHAAAMKALYGACIARGDSLLEAMTVEEDRRLAKSHLDRALTGASLVVEATYGDDALTRSSFEVSHHPIRLADSRIVGVAVFAADTTERRRNADELAQSRQLLLDVTNNSVALIYVLDTEGRFLLANDKLARLLGVDREKLLGQTRLVAMPADVAARHRANDVQVIRTRQPQVFEEENEEADGKHTYLTLKYPLSRMDGTVYAVGGMSTDITDRKRAKEELEASEQRFHRAVLDSPFPMLLHAEDGAVLQVSNSWCEVTGYTREELATMDDWTERAYGDRKERVQADIEALYGLERRKAEGDYSIRIKDGTTRIWEFSSTPLGCLPDGRRLALSMAMDVTERRTAESEVRRLNAELEQRVVERTDRLKAANQDLEAFSYSVSHDLRAPLRHIDGFSGLLLERCRADLTDQGRHYVDTIADSARQMGRLIDDLLQFSRNGRVEMHEAGVDMNRAVREALNTVANEWAGRTIEWVIGDLPPVRGDGAMLRLVWTNLLGNAIKYTQTKAKARIEVTADEGPDETTFVVRDDGVGFDMRYAHKLFGVFQRLHSKAEFEGTGIGLATVRRIVSRHGGRTWAEAELGTGAAFYFTLPRSRGDGPCPS